jgi:hypothetical protein
MSIPQNFCFLARRVRSLRVGLQNENCRQRPCRSRPIVGNRAAFAKVLMRIRLAEMSGRPLGFPAPSACHREAGKSLGQI